MQCASPPKFGGFCMWWSFLSEFYKRPKHILLFVNPFGGKQNAMQIYEKYGKNLFAIAGVEVNVNVSQRKDQIKDFLITHNLDMFDSVACVGEWFMGSD